MSSNHPLDRREKELKIKNKNCLAHSYTILMKNLRNTLSYFIIHGDEGTDVLSQAEFSVYNKKRKENRA
jgi:hypothetical protein